MTMKKFQESCVEIRRQKPRVAGGNTKPHGRRPMFKRKTSEKIIYKQPRREGKKIKKAKVYSRRCEVIASTSGDTQTHHWNLFFPRVSQFRTPANRRNCEPLSCVVCLWPSDMGAPVKLRSKSHLMNRHTKLENAALAS